MTTDSINDWSTTPSLNTNIAGVNIDVGCPPADVGQFMRISMAQVAYAVQGSGGTIPATWHVGTLTATTANVTNLSIANFTPTTITASGSIAASQFIPTGAGIPTAGMYQTGANEVAFASGSGYRMKFDASGNLLINTTVTNPITSGVGGMVLGTSDNLIINSPATPISAGTSVTTGTLVSFFTGGNVFAGSITGNGAAVGYNTTSDQRLKVKIGAIEYIDATDVIERIAALWFHWKDGDLEPQPGFFAQQVHRICPWAVTKGRGRPESKNYRPWQMDASKLMPFVIAYIQGLGKRVADLEKART